MIERFRLRPDYEISRVIKGGWQLSEGHSGEISKEPVRDMLAFVERGIDTFDCADIYTGVEKLIGRFVRANQQSADPLPIKVHTKYVPDYDQLGHLSKAKVEQIVDRSLQRLGLEQLDMVQFHWWDYGIPGMLEAATWLEEIRKEGKINLLSTTNFNTENTNALVENGFPMATVQVQYSLLDPRPEKALIPLCARHGSYLLCYGTLAGGFLSERWLGIPEPETLENRSLVKYKLMIEEVGGWEIFQELLKVLKRIADKHGATIATIAPRYILDQPQVGAVIIGSRNADHIERYASIFQIELDTQDQSAIDAIRQQMTLPPEDVFDLERDKTGRHGRIMKYNLNAR
ncbi:MAG: aldo/keto reductase [Bacteroidota bacterium]